MWVSMLKALCGVILGLLFIVNILAIQNLNYLIHLTFAGMDFDIDLINNNKLTR